MVVASSLPALLARGHVPLGIFYITITYLKKRIKLYLLLQYIFQYSPKG